MVVLIWLRVRYICGFFKLNSIFNVIRLVIWFLVFFLRMRKFYIFIYEIGFVNVDVGEFSMLIIVFIFFVN